MPVETSETWQSADSTVSRSSWSEKEKASCRSEVERCWSICLDEDDDDDDEEEPDEEETEQDEVSSRLLDQCDLSD